MINSASPARSCCFSFRTSLSLHGYFLIVYLWRVDTLRVSCCPEAEFMIKWRFLMITVTFEAPAPYSKRNHWDLLLLARRWLLLTDARLFLQIDIFNYTSSRLFHRAEFLMRLNEEGEAGGVEEASPAVSSFCWCSRTFTSCFLFVRSPGFNMSRVCSWTARSLGFNWVGWSCKLLLVFTAGYTDILAVSLCH